MNTKDFVLRPRFKKELNATNKEILSAFEMSKTTQKKVLVSRVDNHIYLRVPKEIKHFWSPQLHLEIDAEDNSSSLLHGVFGPNPSSWTLFMFFHFIIGGMFLAFGVWAYSNYSLGESYRFQLILLFFMIALWFVLYFLGRMGKHQANEQMHLLYDFMNSILES